MFFLLRGLGHSSPPPTTLTRLHPHLTPTTLHSHYTTLTHSLTPTAHSTTLALCAVGVSVLCVELMIALLRNNTSIVLEHRIIIHLLFVAPPLPWTISYSFYPLFKLFLNIFLIPVIGHVWFFHKARNI